MTADGPASPDARAGHAAMTRLAPQLTDPHASMIHRPQADRTRPPSTDLRPGLVPPGGWTRARFGRTAGWAKVAS